MEINSGVESYFNNDTHGCNERTKEAFSRRFLEFIHMRLKSGNRGATTCLVQLSAQ